MNKWVKRGLIGMGSVVGLIAVVGGVFVFTQVSAYNSSVARKYDDVPLPVVTRSTDPKVIERGKHLSESIGGACSASDCHSADLGGGKKIEMGPLGSMQAPNMTMFLPAYSDGELARLIRHGVKRDGTTVIMMPAHEFGWQSLEDVGAIISYLRTVPPVSRPTGGMQVGLLGKILDRQDKIPLDIARRINHPARAKEVAPAPEPSAKYGEYLAKGCFGCHGEKLSGGPIPGAPASMAVPRNITPHDTGLKAWAFEDFDKVCMQGVSKDGKKLDPMMPYEALSKCNETEKKALWAFLQTVPAVAFGNR